MRTATWARVIGAGLLVASSGVGSAVAHTSPRDAWAGQMTVTITGDGPAVLTVEEPLLHPTDGETTSQTVVWVPNLPFRRSFLPAAYAIVSARTASTQRHTTIHCQVTLSDAAGSAPVIGTGHGDNAAVCAHF